ncbi:MAG: tetratricopeptide repeat protein [Myxococcota bacterium]|nr:tetratricopeptide repeat protein [Myxococcota bacterium]
MRRCAIGFAFLVALACGCAGRVGPFGGDEPLRLSDVEGSGDATRRASMHLCVQGLDADAAGRSRSALVYYERAIQMDATNPYAYLVLARHQVERGDADEALDTLNRAEQLLAAESALSPRVEVHLSGLKGAALEAAGRDGARELADASRVAPTVWSDGRLSAAELR